jgi:preprotein translocase subunit SecF
MFIIKNKFVFISISAVLVATSIILVAVFGLKLGIDFKGGALTEVNYPEGRPSIEAIQTAVKTLPIGEAIVQEAGNTGVIVKSRDLTDAERTSLLKTLAVENKKVEEKTFTSIGPSVGKELARKSILAIILVALAIILFIAFAFRKVSEPVSSWKYGLIAIVTLVHDIALPSGVFALLSHFKGAEVDTLFVVALLTVLGLSVSDTIVVFDRIRENLRLRPAGESFDVTVGTSISQTFTRSINTSLTVILALLALFFFGPETTKNFALILVTGMFFGTYSSIFVASPILVLVEEWQRKNKKKNK